MISTAITPTDYSATGADAELATTAGFAEKATSTGGRRSSGAAATYPTVNDCPVGKLVAQVDRLPIWASDVRRMPSYCFVKT